MLAPLARQSRGCRERSARGPGPGHRTPYRTRPSLKLGQLPTSDIAPDTAPHRAGHYNGHYFPAPDIAPPHPALDAFPLPLRGPRHRAPRRLSKRPLAAQRQTLPPPSPLSLPLLPPHNSPAGVGAPPVSPTPCSSARLPAPPSPGCSPGCLSPGDCGGSSAAVEALLFCTGTTGTASLAGTGTRTRTRRPLSCGPRVQRAAGGAPWT